jgi:uncharacterized protein with NRDE domain
MCLLALYYRTTPGAPLVLAAQRDEYFARRARPPEIQAGEPAVLCGRDARAGGTWLGVNAHGLLVAVTNRNDVAQPIAPRSRGLLCRELLGLSDAREAADFAQTELESGRYAGATFLCAARDEAIVVSSDDELSRHELTPGRYLVGNGPPRDDHDPRLVLAAELLPAGDDGDAATLIATLSDVYSQPADENERRSIVLRTADRGTVSATLVALTADTEQAIYRYAPGPPDRTKFDDYSPALREVLGSG